MSTSRSPSSFSWASVAGRPLIQARLLPCASSTRRSSTSSPSAASSCSASHAPTAGASATSNVAASSARSAPGRSCRSSKRSPSSSPSASSRMDLPAPVSPVSTVRPGVEFDVERVDDDEVADGERAQHRRERSEGTRNENGRGGRFRSGGRRPARRSGAPAFRSSGASRAAWRSSRGPPDAGSARESRPGARRRGRLRPA